MEYVAHQNDNGEWRVEAIDHHLDGRVITTIFLGQDAESRAKEYAAWKNAGAS